MSTKETRELLSFALGIFNWGGRSLQDGKVDWNELIALGPKFLDVSKAFEGIEQIPTELKNMNPQEAKDLIEYAKKEFDIPQDKVEMIVESSLEILYRIYKLFKDLGHVK